VAASPRKALNRLSQTSWDELRTRFSQEFTKRADYARYRAGLLAQPQVLSNPSGDSSFFFQLGELPNRVALIKQHLPLAVEQTVQEANEILQHRFRLLGYRDLDYGPQIDWHLDAVRGKRAPLKPWYKVRFLDYNEVGDHKVTWELNRHQHLVTLAKAWTFTRDDQYPREIAEQFYSWQSANPYPMGINWGSSLEVAFRSLSWLWVRNLIKEASGIPSSFDHDLVRGLARSAQYIERFLSTYFSPNTHLIGEAVALFFIGTLCPDIPEARGWQEKGLAIVLEEAERQVRPDGVYFEQSLYYHVYALDFFLHARALAACNQLQVPDLFDLVLHNMLRVVQVLSCNGVPEGFGDDDGGRVFNPRRNRIEHMSDPLALGAALFQDQGLLETAELTEEAIWLFGEKALLATAPRTKTTNTSTAFRDGGLYVMASDHAQMLIDAGPHGSGRGGHGHADALSIRLSMNDRRWLVDPGSYLYIGPEEDPQVRDKFRGTAAHNTLRVDRLDQETPDGPFSWKSLPDVQTEEWIASPGFDFFSGAHTGYKRLSDPVVHRRMIFHLVGDYWLVRDIAEGKDVHDLELHWHFAPELQLAVGDESLVAMYPDRDALTLLSVSPTKWDIAIEDGYVSAAYGEKQPASVGAFRKRTQLPAEHLTLLLPLGRTQTAGNLRLTSAESSMYAYAHDGLTDVINFGTPAVNPAFESFRSDAKFLFARSLRGEIERVILCGASFLDVNGEPVFRSESNAGWMQWSRTEGGASSDPKLLKFFDQEILRSRTAVPLRQ
jgi:Heparinase II/III-like protein/Heparinase II/III N-terminus